MAPLFYPTILDFGFLQKIVPVPNMYLIMINSRKKHIFLIYTKVLDMINLRGTTTLATTLMECAHTNKFTSES